MIPVFPIINILSTSKKRRATLKKFFNNQMPPNAKASASHLNPAKGPHYLRPHF
jgi:hypothetical protein